MMDKYVGTWLIANPDKGQSLGDGDLLVVGGAYEIGSRLDVKAVLDLRGADGKLHRRRLHGTGRRGREGSLIVSYFDHSVDCLVVNPEGLLIRAQSNLPSVESEIRMFRAPDNRLMLPPVAPGMLFNTMPKSGSIYISTYLANGLRVNQMKIAVSLFPDDLVLRNRLDILAAGDAICQQHVPAKDINVRFIAARTSKIVVHLRDPRQAMLSWVHHLDNFYANRSLPDCALGLEATTPALPDDYFDWSFEQKVDFQIEHHLAQLVQWTENWLLVADNRPYGLDVHVTTFEEYVAAPHSVIEGILAFYEIPAGRFDWQAAPTKTPQVHFRKGLTDEWRSTLTEKQTEATRAIVSGSLCNRFGWPL